jgi:hypothetical protein
VTTVGLPPSGRAIHREVSAAVAAAAARDPAALRDACARLRGFDELQVRDVLHTLTLGLIEQAFPDGLDAGDLRTVLADVTRSAAAWLPSLDPYAVAVVLTGALSVQVSAGETEAPPVDADALPLACVLAVGYLLQRLSVPLEPELTRVFESLREAQTMEMP